MIHRLSNSNFHIRLYYKIFLLELFLSYIYRLLWLIHHHIVGQFIPYRPVKATSGCVLCVLKLLQITSELLDYLSQMQRLKQYSKVSLSVFNFLLAPQFLLFLWYHYAIWLSNSRVISDMQSFAEFVNKTDARKKSVKMIFERLCAKLLVSLQI